MVDLAEARNGWRKTEGEFVAWGRPRGLATLGGALTAQRPGESGRLFDRTCVCMIRGFAGRFQAPAANAARLG
jgi:hypothetical protein